MVKRVILDFETGIEEFSEQDKDWPRIQNHWDFVLVTWVSMKCFGTREGVKSFICVFKCLATSVISTICCDLLHNFARSSANMSGLPPSSLKHDSEKWMRCEMQSSWALCWGRHCHHHCPITKQVARHIQDRSLSPSVGDEGSTTQWPLWDIFIKGDPQVSFPFHQYQFYF